jgi:hypothetical protein
VKERSIGDDRRHAILGTDHHVEGSGRWSAQQFSYQGVIVDDPGQIVSRGLILGSFVGPPTDRSAR